MFRGPHFIISTMQAETIPIFKVFGMTGPSTNLESTPQNLLVGARSPYRRLLRSAGATKDLFVSRGLLQEPPPRIPTGSWRWVMLRSAPLVRSVYTAPGTPVTCCRRARSAKSALLTHRPGPKTDKIEDPQWEPAWLLTTNSAFSSPPNPLAKCATTFLPLPPPRHDLSRLNRF